MTHRGKYFDILYDLDLIDSFPTTSISLGLFNYQTDLKKTLNDLCLEENLRVDNFNRRFTHLEQKKWSGIFSMDVWVASTEYVEMLHWNNISIPIQEGDLMVALHIDAPDYNNNPNNFTVKELFIFWLKRAQIQISDLSPNSPKYITCFSHLAWKLSKKYPIFQNFDISNIFQQESWANKNVFQLYDLLWFGNQSLIDKMEYELKDPLTKFVPYGKKKLKDKLSIHKSAITLRKKYFPSDISLAVASVDDFLAYDFS